MKSRGCREHWRTMENARDEFLHKTGLTFSTRIDNNLQAKSVCTLASMQGLMFSGHLRLPWKPHGTNPSLHFVSLCVQL